ncbi:MAG TPA: ComEC/Rec2 family competence protein [Tepidisphaeraceae bacterium]|jgi:competence protein ComEC
MNDGRDPKVSFGLLICRYPAVLAAVCFVLGIFAHRPLPAAAVGWVWAAVVLAAGSLFLIRFGWISSLALGLALLFAGAASAQHAALYFANTDIAMFTRESPTLAKVELQITDAPRIVKSPSHFRKDGDGARQVTRARVVRVLTTKGWQPGSGAVLVHLDEPLAKLRVNATIRGIGMLSRPARAMNPGQFDWASYYRDDRILASCAFSRGDAVKIVSDPGPGWLDRLRASSRELLAAGFDKRQSVDHALLRALVLGDSDPELRDVQEDFRRTGTSHHLAISGMHVAILGGIVYLLLLVLQVTPRKSLLISLGIVMLYGVVVLPSPPVNRSILLCIAFAIGILRRRSVSGVQLLSLTALAMLVQQPMDLYNAGFQLSFGTVLGLMLLTRQVQRRYFQRDPDEVVVLSLMGPRAPRLMRWKHWILQHVSTALSAGIVAWLVSLPLILHHFEQLNPWAIVASLLLGVFVLLALVGGFAKILLTLVIPPLAGTWAVGAGCLVALMRHVLELLAKLPGSDIPLPSFGLAAMLVYYAMLLVLLFGRFPLPSLPRLKRAAALGSVGAFSLVPFLGIITSPHPQQLKLTTLSLGAGLCNILELPGGGAAAVDAGSSSVTELHAKIIAPFLRHEGCGTVDTLFLSHRDYDHISAAGELVEHQAVTRVFVPGPFHQYAQESAPGRDLLRFLHNHRRDPKPLKIGDLVPLARGAAVSVIWPPMESSFDSNDTGLVLRLTYAGRSILFPADIQAPAQAELLKHPERLKSDILIAPHHGSSEWTTPAFLAAVDPRLIISSDDNTPTQKQKHFDQMAMKYRVLHTRESGAISINISSDGNIDVNQFLKLDK